MLPILTLNNRILKNRLFTKEVTLLALRWSLTLKFSSKEEMDPSETDQVLFVFLAL